MNVNVPTSCAHCKYYYGMNMRCVLCNGGDKFEQAKDGFPKVTHKIHPPTLSEGSISSIIERLTREEHKYMTNDIYVTTSMVKQSKKGGPEIQKVVFNDPATIVFWSDKTKTVVKCQNDEAFDPEKGLAMAITKKFFGNEGNYFNEIKKWTDDYEKEQSKLAGILDSLERFNKDGSLAEAVRKLRGLAKNIKEQNVNAKVQNAYNALFNVVDNPKATKTDLKLAMEDAMGFLGEVLD